MTYRQITSEERYMLAILQKQGLNQSDIARALGRHRSSISRELKRNRSRWDGYYRPSKADEKTRGRRARSRKKSQFGPQDWAKVQKCLREDWSPEQISGHLREAGQLAISHETIYRHVRRDRKDGGLLYKHLRFWRKKWRKRYRSHDSRGRLQGKRMIGDRPASIERRQTIGHWEVDTVMGRYGTKPCILTLVERKTGFLLIGKLEARTKEEANRRTLSLIHQHQEQFQSITADNGTEFHGYADVESASGVKYYFATPYHAWERGTNENTNGLIRQYLPKGMSLEALTQHNCNAIANKLNNRPRKRHRYQTPSEVFYGM